MSLEEDIKKFGAKGAVLNYIHKSDKTIPIEEFVLVSVDEDWRNYKKIIDTMGDCLVRSSSPLEDGTNISFAGLFHTSNYKGSDSVRNVLRTIKDKDALNYAKIHGIESPLTMGLVFQKKSESRINWGMLRHPNKPELIFIMGKPRDDDYVSFNYIYNEIDEKLQDINLFCLNKLEKENINEHESIKEAIEMYKQIEKLPAFNNEYTYHMEFGTLPLSIYQFRPFKKKEISDWDLSSLSLFKSNDIKYNLVFGITPREGIELTVVRALNSHDNRDQIEYHRKRLIDLPYKERVRKLLKQWNLNEHEKVYASEVVKIPRNIYGAVESQAFTRAKSKLNNKFANENVALYQTNMHYHFGKAIDLVFPNAQAWIPQGGLQFLSHDWFRSIQHYPIVLASYLKLDFETGDNVKVYSDGIKGCIQRA